jgi:hypothetical protein
MYLTFRRLHTLEISFREMRSPELSAGGWGMDLSIRWYIVGSDLRRNPEHLNAWTDFDQKSKHDCLSSISDRRGWSSGPTVLKSTEMTLSVLSNPFICRGMLRGKTADPRLTSVIVTFQPDIQTRQHVWQKRLKQKAVWLKKNLYNWKLRHNLRSHTSLNDVCQFPTLPEDSQTCRD